MTKTDVPASIDIPRGYGVIISKALERPLDVVLASAVNDWRCLKFAPPLIPPLRGATLAWAFLPQAENEKHSFLQLTFEPGWLGHDEITAELWTWADELLGYPNPNAVFVLTNPKQVGVILPINREDGSVCFALNARLDKYVPLSEMGTVSGAEGEAWEQRLKQGANWASFTAKHESEVVFGGLSVDEQIEVLKAARGAPPLVGLPPVSTSTDRRDATFAALRDKVASMHFSLADFLPAPGKFYKAISMEESDFDDESIKYAPGAAILPTRLTREDRRDKGTPDGHIFAADAPAEALIGAAWPCRLYMVEGEPTTHRNPDEPHGRMFTTLRAVKELPASRIFGPLGDLVLRFFARLGDINSPEWAAIVRFARASEDASDSLAAGQAAWDAVFTVADVQCRVQAVNASVQLAADDAQRRAYLAPWQDVLRSAPRGSDEKEKALLALSTEKSLLNIGWGAIGQLVGNDATMAGVVAGRAAGALVVADRLAPEDLSTLTEPFNSVLEPNFWTAERQSDE